MREGLVVGLANHTLLVAKDDTERPIDDSAAPIRNANGEVTGVVLVFRDITDRREQEQAIQDSLNYCEGIMATLREPFLVLDDKLRVKTAYRRFYETFKVSPEETEKRLSMIWAMGSGTVLSLSAEGGPLSINLVPWHSLCGYELCSKYYVAKEVMPR